MGSVFMGWFVAKKIWNETIAIKVGWTIALFPSLILYSVFKNAIAPSWMCLEIVVIFSVPVLCLLIHRLLINEYNNYAQTESKLEIENEHLSKRGRMMFADDNNILEVQNIEKVDFEFQNVEDYYDLIILDDVDHVLTVEQLSKLIFSAKKLIIKTIDRPESIIYKTDLSVFFLRYIDENLQSKEENNDSDFYIYREKMAYFNGFEENNI